MKAVQLSKVTILCDLCKWHKEILDTTIEDWHKMPCPDCGQGEIIDDKDLEIWKQLKTSIDIFSTIEVSDNTPVVEVLIKSNDYK